MSMEAKTETTTILTEPAKLQPDTTPAPAQDAEAAELPKWMTELPDDIKAEPSLKNYKDVASLAKSLVHAQKMVGADKIAVPNPKTATEDDYRKVFQKLGLPETIDKYDLGKIEGANEELLKGFKEAAHKAGILPSQAKKVLEFYQQAAKASGDAHANKLQSEVSAGLNALKQEWGQGFEKEVTAAKIALKEFGDESLNKLLHDTGMGNHPAVIKLLNRVGKALKEDAVLGASAGRDFGMTPQEAQSEIGKIMADPAYWTKDHPMHDQMVARAMQLREAVNTGQF